MTTEDSFPIAKVIIEYKQQIADLSERVKYERAEKYKAIKRADYLRAVNKELLSALEKLDEYFVGIGLEDDEDGDPNPEIVAARAAIAKAKGGTK